MDIGNPKRIITVEPIENPVPPKEVPVTPVPEREPEREREPVPVGPPDEDREAVTNGR
jgi:hypothetical protein